MGRTIPSYRIQVEVEQARWRRGFSKGILKSRKKTIERTFDLAFRYASAGGYAARLDPRETIVLSTLLAQENMLQTLSRMLEKDRRRRLPKLLRPEKPDEQNSPEPLLGEAKN